MLSTNFENCGFFEEVRKARKLFTFKDQRTKIVWLPAQVDVASGLAHWPKPKSDVVWTQSVGGCMIAAAMEKNGKYAETYVI
jgi:hypothetical protein